VTSSREDVDNMSREEIGRVARVGRGCYEDYRNKSCVSDRSNLENDTTHGKTGSTTPQQTAGRSITRVASWTASRHARHAPIVVDYTRQDVTSMLRGRRSRGI